MQTFEVKQLPVERTDVAPDGSDVRVLLQLERGGLGHFELGAGKTSVAMAHRTVQEIWYVIRGQGEMWRQLGGVHAIVPLETGTCVSIPVGTRFQFRSTDQGPLSIVGVTMPPWPGEGEAFEVPGQWESNL